MPRQVGKKYVCKKCGVEFIVTRGGKGELYCCGQKMEIKKQHLYGYALVLIKNF